MAAPLISIIIPTHNRPVFLANAITSVRQQTYGNWELIIIDDGSAAGCYEALKRANQAAKIHWLRHDKAQGPGYARRTGIEAAKGEYLAFLDDDDYYLPDHFQRLVANIATTDRMILRSGLIGCDTDGQQTTFNGYSNTESTLEQYWRSPSNLLALLLHREAVARVPIDLSRTTIEDFTWLTRVFSHYDLYQTNDYTAVYLLHDANRNNSPANRQHLADRLATMETAYAYGDVSRRIDLTIKNRWVYHQYLHFARNSMRTGKWLQAWNGIKDSVPYLTRHGVKELMYTGYFAGSCVLGLRR
jgi:glycosyltransferase involved in cell wall biosynthesis